VRNLGRRVDKEGGRLSRAGWRVAGGALARQVVLRRFPAVAADETGCLLSGAAALAGRGGVGSPQRNGVLNGWQTGIATRVALHALRHSFASYLLGNHYDDRFNASAGTAQELLGNQEAETAMATAHAHTALSERVLNRGGLAVRSPLD
jgi:integrase